jgi:hypothetical protein
MAIMGNNQVSQLCGLQHTNPLICVLYISINFPCVPLHLMYQSLNNTLRARGLWWHMLIILHRTCHGEVHETKKKAAEEERKGLALLGHCCKALTLNLLTQALTNSYLAPQDGEGNQQVSNLDEGVSMLARESL